MSALIDFLAVDGQGTFRTFGIPCGADLPAEEYDPVAEVGAVLRGQNLTELALYLLRVTSFA